MKNKNSKIFKIIAWSIIIFNALLLIALLIYLFSYKTFIVSGDSMDNTLEHKDKIYVNKLENIDRFDIVVFKSEKWQKYAHVKSGKEHTFFVKRVIGLPNDEVSYKSGVLYVNGVPYIENYTSSKTYNFDLDIISGHSKVPANMYFVLGDNRINSFDSREDIFKNTTKDKNTFNFISKEEIEGVVKLKYNSEKSYHFISNENAVSKFNAS